MQEPNVDVPAARDDHQVAIIGSGPSGCFTAQALRKRLPSAQLTVFDSMPTPYGLVRHGIAADHQGAKAVHHQFDRLFTQPGIRFVGNTTVGRDVPWEAVLRAFDAVVLATGLPQDRRLDVTPEAGVEVIGAGELLRVLNSDPDSALRHRRGGLPSLGDDVAIIGTGNVAMDVARLLTKSLPELARSDVDDVARNLLVPQPIKTITVIGRCEPGGAKWDASMLSELGAVDAVDLRLDGRRSTEHVAPEAASTRIDVRFRQVLHSLTAHGRRTRLVTTAPDDAANQRSFVVDSVISAVGFEAGHRASPSDVLALPQVFRVGGCATGRLGNLAENRKLAAAAAREIADYLGGTRAGGGLLDPLFLPPRHVDFDAWTRIEAAETRRARPDRCRTKFTTRDELLAVAGVLAADELEAAG